MKRLIAFVFMALSGAAVAAETPQPTPSEQVFGVLDQTDLSQFVWIKRPVIVFADSPNDPRFAEQMALLEERVDALAERDVVVLVDTDPAAKSDLRRKLRPRGFMLVLIGKDGGVKLRKPFPWDVRELSRSIDKMPMRKQELRGSVQSD